MITAFPFVFAKNRFLEHRCVVSPSFADRSLSAQLRRTADGTVSSEGTIFHMSCPVEGDEAYDAFFIARDARQRDIGESGDAFLRDDSGRRFILVVGFLTRGSDSVRDISESCFHLLENSIQAPMRKFWKAREWNSQRIFFPDGLNLPVYCRDGRMLRTVDFALRREYFQRNTAPEPVTVPKSKRTLLFVGAMLIAVSIALPYYLRVAAIAIGCGVIAWYVMTSFRK